VPLGKGHRKLVKNYVSAAENGRRYELDLLEEILQKGSAQKC